MSSVCRSFNDLLVVKIISKSMIVSLGITSYLQEFRSRVASLLKLHDVLQIYCLSKIIWLLVKPKSDFDLIPSYGVTGESNI